MFKNREEAGKLLGEKLRAYAQKDILVIGITRGGVVVAKTLASVLKVPLDIIVVKKIGAPNNPELAIGAVGPSGVTYWDKILCERLGVSKSQKLNLKNKKLLEQKQLAKLLRKDDSYVSISEKTIILIDDGVATGATVMTAVKFFKKIGVKKILLATPVIARDTLERVKKYFSQVIFLESPFQFYAVGQFYKEFPQVEDKEIKRLLKL